MIHRFHVGQLRALGAVSFLGGTLLSACTLITDVNREDIPTDPTPMFPATDAGSDAAVPVPDPVEPVDAGDRDAGEVLGDAGADAGDGGDVDETIDAGADAG